MPFNVKIASNYALIKKIENFWDPPKKAQGYERSRYGCMDKSYECTQCTGGLLGIAQSVYSQLHAQVFVHSSSP